jgi:hypothetical protein
MNFGPLSRRRHRQRVLDCVERQRRPQHTMPRLHHRRPGVDMRPVAGMDAMARARRSRPATKEGSLAPASTNGVIVVLSERCRTTFPSTESADSARHGSPSSLLVWRSAEPRNDRHRNGQGFESDGGKFLSTQRGCMCLRLVFRLWLDASWFVMSPLTAAGPNCRI